MRSSAWHALGNRYVLVERRRLGPLDDAAARELARGADGVLEVVAAGAGEVEIVVWNPDGSRAELSGNGARIAAAWLAERTGADEVVVRVGPRSAAAWVLPDGRIRQDLGAVEVGAEEEVEGVRFVPVTVGNPHAVVVGDPDDIGRLGPLLEAHPRFPERTNVEAVRVERPGEVRARVWERGVGETSASGTGAVAAAAATHGRGEVLVRFPGGDLEVELAGGRALLTGPAERID